MMMKEKHSYIIRTALMAASGILLCGIAEAVRPEVVYQSVCLLIKL